VKVSIGMTLTSGPWGGGNQFGHALASYLAGKSVEVSFDLKNPDLDVVLLAEPDCRLAISAYSHRDILRYLLFRNRHCVVVHRVNNTSEARDDPDKVFNKFRINANKVADHTVFVSEWVHERYAESGFDSPNYSVILNGGDERIWRRNGGCKRHGKLRLVTHHWSSNLNKGLDIYARLDRMLRLPEYSKHVSFTYIGNLPQGFRFGAADHLAPISGKALADAIREHDVYLTASRNESGPMHCVEGALCGLPLLYRKSGALPEYCGGFGIPFTTEDFEQGLRRMMADHDAYRARMKDYPLTASRMCEHYHKLFAELVGRRDKVLAKRSWQRRPVWLLRTLLGRV